MISWSGNCLACAKDKVTRNIESLGTHSGPEFARWRVAHAAAVGAVFPNETRPPNVPQLSPRQQRSSRDTTHWRKMSRARLAYAEGICEVQLPGCTVSALIVHLNPALGGNHRLATLDDCRAVCNECHGHIHSQANPHDTLAIDAAAAEG